LQPCFEITYRIGNEKQQQNDFNGNIMIISVSIFKVLISYEMKNLFMSMFYKIFIKSSNFKPKNLFPKEKVSLRFFLKKMFAFKFPMKKDMS